jgi:hypothetical protein
MLCAHIHSHKVYDTSETQTRFPVVCNKNQTLLECDLDAKRLKMDFYDQNQKIWKTLTYKVGTFK